MAKKEMLDRLEKAESFLIEVVNFVSNLEDDGEFKLSMLAKLTDAEEYISSSKQN